MLKMSAGKPTEAKMIAKHFLIIFVPLVLILSIILFLFYNAESNNHKELVKNEASAEINHMTEAMKTQFQLVLSDLMFLSEQNELQQALDINETIDWGNLATEYLSFSARKQIYDQIRFIDETGMEIVRVDFNDGNPVIVPHDQLQSKAKRYYFEDTFILALGEVFFSPMDLNIEHGEIEQPLKQMIRLGTPIFNRDGHKEGVVILNYLAHNMTHHLELTPGGFDQIMLLNSDGYWLHSPNPEDEWGFMYPDKEDRTFGNDFPKAWLTIATDESGQFFNTDGLFTFVTIYPLLEGQKSSAGSGLAFEPSEQQISAKEYYWKLVVYMPLSALSAAMGTVSNMILMIFTLMVVVAARGSWVGARAIVRRKKAEEDLQEANAQLDVKVKERTADLVKTNKQLRNEITERKKMQEQLIISDRLASIGELVSGVAHELNNPMTGIIGFSDLLLAQDISDDIKQDLEIINKEAKRTAEIVKGLLTFARKQKTEKQPVNINEVIQAVLNLRAYEHKLNNIEVDTHFVPDLPEIIANSSQLQQVFLNLVVNAEQAMLEAHNKGILTITSEQVGDIVKVSFADDGPGITQENLGHLFDPFFTTKEKGKGTGLGLSISYGIITDHGGLINAENNDNGGATFAVQLPVYPKT